MFLIKLTVPYIAKVLSQQKTIKTIIKIISLLKDFKIKKGKIQIFKRQRKKKDKKRKTPLSGIEHCSVTLQRRAR